MQDNEKKKEEANKRNFITSSSKKRNATDQPTLLSRGITYSTPYKITDNLHKTRFFFFNKKECFYLYIVFFY